MTAPWQARALCAEVGGDLFYSDDDARDNDLPQVNYRPAIEVCQACPVWRECRFVGVAEAFGVWGGTSPRDRAAIRREARLTSQVSTVDVRCESDDLTALRTSLVDALASAGGDVDDALSRFPALAGMPLMYDVAVRRPA